MLEQKVFVEDWEVYEPTVDFGDLKPGDCFKLPGEEHVVIGHKIAKQPKIDYNYIWFDSYEECHSDFMKDETKVVEL